MLLGHFLEERPDGDTDQDAPVGPTGRTPRFV